MFAKLHRTLSADDGLKRVQMKPNSSTRREF